MKFRNAIKSIFGGIKNYVSSAWKEIGSYSARFTSFGTDIYANDVVRSCIRTLAKHTSKASPSVLRDGKTVDKRLQDMLEYRPNVYMNGKDFLQKVRTLYEINNTVFIYIQRDERMEVVGVYPMPAGSYEALDVGGALYIKFVYPNMTTVLPWDDLAVLRKDYNKSDIFGDTNDAILTSLDLLDTTNQGMANAIKSTANLRGLVKSSKAMLSEEDTKRIRDQFVTSYMDIANTSGVAALDSTLTFTPIEMKPAVANYKSIEELRNNIHRYFGTNDDIVMSKATPDQMDAFYDAEIEPFILALSLELTFKIFSYRKRTIGTEIVYAADRMSFMSTANKLSLVQLVDRGAMTPNQWARVFNLPPQPGGNVPKLWQDPQNTGGSNVTPTDMPGVDTEGVVDDAEKVTGKTLNGAQTQSLITVVTQFAAGTLTLGQAVNIIAIAIGVTKEEAQKLLEGAV